MNRRKSEVSARLKSDAAGENLLHRRVIWLALGAMVVGAVLYSPTLHGRFIFDDDALPFRQGVRSASLGAWVAGVRPFLMFSYWLNYRISGSNPYSYHVLNIVIHAVNTSLVFVVLLRLLALAEWPSKKRSAAAIIGALVFLIHPLATESVSYIAGRSESLAAMFVLIAYAVFLNGYSAAISWGRSALVVGLFAMAVATKENAVALAGVLVLTDVSWPKPYSVAGLRRNYRLYVLMTPGIVAAAIWAGRILSQAQSAGFALKDLAWYQYGFTQGRAIFSYLRLAVFPIGQSVDHDFPISRSVSEYGAIFYLVLLAALLIAAILLRRKYSVASFGFLLFLILLAPTSSVIPIADPLVERRMYLPMIGLVLIACQTVRSLRWANGPVSLLVGLLIVLGGLCYQRNQLWGKPEQVWASAAEESTTKGRPFLGLAESLVAENRCGDAVPYLQRGERLMPGDFAVQVAWGKVLECQGKRPEALQRLERAASIMPNSFVYQLIGLLYGEMGKKEQAGAALRKAEELAPENASAHSALGLWYESVGDSTAAASEYRKALALYAYNTEAQNGLARIQSISTPVQP
jgi:tetratricopeptide (TPR) repeat protein